MTKEDKELLIQDLCARLPYGVKTPYSGFEMTIRGVDVESKTIDVIDWGKARFAAVRIEKIKPYLRTMSSMAEEEKEEYRNIDNRSYSCPIDYAHILASERIDWLNKKMFDYRGLILKGLAEIAPEGMYELKLLDYCLTSQNEFDSVIDNTTKITVGCKIRSKTNPDVILRIVSNDCHGDKFECSNGSVLSLKQIEKYYDLNNGTITIN